MTTATMSPTPSTNADSDLHVSAGGRNVVNMIMTVVVWACFIVALIPLVWVLFTVFRYGLLEILRVDWWTESQRGITARREGGGAFHAITGTVMTAGVAAAISVPIGVLTAIYLVEYGRGRLARAVSFTVDILTGVPSIVSALFIYAVWVTIFGWNRVAFSVALSLVLLMIPVVVRSTEEMLKLVPNELREASYALGVPKWKTIWSIVLPTAFSGIVTGILLGMARVMGETAPLLILGPYSKSLNVDMFNGFMAALPTMINQDRTENLDPAIARTWGAALTLILIILVFNLIGRWLSRGSRVKS